MSRLGAHSEQAVKFGRYILLDRINVGGMAEVFRGKMAGVEGFERMVALKRILPSIALDPDFIEMFVDEAKLAVQLQHANIAQIYDLGKAEDLFYIAMEYVSGVDLRTMWDRARQRNRLLPIAMSCYIMQRCCEGLDAAHRKKDAMGRDIGLVHRDVSPQNILVSFEGEVKVIDFGIAKSKTKVSKTQAGILKGKFGYMSPEQVRGIDLDNRSDIFACGAVLYELVVGDRLFLGESDFSTLEKVRNVEMVPPTRLNKNLSPHLERIVMKALAKNRDDRYRWTSEMAEDLQRYLFSSNQPFARTDMQRYMQQHFKEEVEREKERLERYRSITFAQFDDATDTSGIEASAGVATAAEPGGPAGDEFTERRTEVAGGFDRVPTGLQARPLALQEALIADRTALYGSPVPHPTSTSAVGPGRMGIGPAKPRVPSWVAAVIGALVAVVVVAVGLVYYLVRTKPTPGSIILETVPSRANIYLNDKLVGNSSPITLDNLSPNTYVLTVKKEGYQTLIRAVSVVEGEVRIEPMALEPIRGTGSIIVRSQPPGLEIWVDGRTTGRVTPATVTELSEGDRIVVLKRGERIVHRVRVPILDGAAEVVEVDTAKLPAVIDVTSEPSEASVVVNGALRGVTPTTIAHPRPGIFDVVIEKKGCQKFEQSLTVELATVVTVQAALKCEAVGNDAP